MSRHRDNGIGGFMTFMIFAMLVVAITMIVIAP